MATGGQSGQRDHGGNHQHAAVRLLGRRGAAAGAAGTALSFCSWVDMKELQKMK
jgi:hypothetical protein